MNGVSVFECLVDCSQWDFLDIDSAPRTSPDQKDHTTEKQPWERKYSPMFTQTSPQPLHPTEEDQGCDSEPEIGLVISSPEGSYSDEGISSARDKPPIEIIDGGIYTPQCAPGTLTPRGKRLNTRSTLLMGTPRDSFYDENTPRSRMQPLLQPVAGKRVKVFKLARSKGVASGSRGGVVSSRGGLQGHKGDPALGLGGEAPAGLELLKRSHSLGSTPRRASLTPNSMDSHSLGGGGGASASPPDMLP
ncbi:unnamed protein product, partial [Discosporangium mesarthrocarpum]